MNRMRDLIKEEGLVQANPAAPINEVETVYLGPKGKISLHEMVKQEPGFAVAQIQRGDRAIEALEKIRDIDIEHYMNQGEYLFSLKIRELISWGLGK